MAKVKAETTELVTEEKNKAMVAFDYGEDEGAGFENQTSKDTQIPFVIILQPQSPQVLERVKDGNGRIVQAGDYYCEVMNQSWSGETGFKAVFCSSKNEYVEWKSRDEGGGFVGRHAIDSEVVLNAIKTSTDFGKYKSPQGNSLVETYYLYGILCDDKDQPEAMFAFACAKSKIKAYKAFNTRVKMHLVPGPGGKKVRPPMYANYVKLTTELKKFDDGSAYVPIIMPADPRGIDASMLLPDDERFIMAKATKMMIDEGKAKIDYEKQAGTEGTTEDTPF